MTLGARGEGFVTYSPGPRVVAMIGPYARGFWDEVFPTRLELGVNVSAGMFF